MGGAYYDMGQFHKAIICCEQALQMAIEREDAERQHHYMGVMGRVYSNLGKPRAIDLYQQAITIARRLEDHHHAGVYLGRLSVAYRRSGQVQQAITLYQEALSLLRESSDRAEYERHLGDLGSAYRELGQFEKVIQFHSAPAEQRRGALRPAGRPPAGVGAHPADPVADQRGGRGR
ncbi:MAG TPA: tetratricopeptide repeat protein [Anaerolineae bacterium]|nr:tetratricopeptide repeat protein [Anaerolineae bacterium]